MQPRIYTYKITFEEVPHYYYGSHKEKRFGEYYMGSPETHKWMWDFYTPKKQVLELFDFNDEGYKEAIKVENRLIRPVFNTDPLCLNENCGGVPSLNARKRGTQTQKEKSIGLFNMTSEEKSKAGKKGAEKCRELGTGLFKMTPEQRSEYARLGALKTMENRTGIFSQTQQELSENAKKVNAQKWQCTKTGYVTNAGALTHYQRAKGIDTSNRIRIG
jgi:hypothetical protein